MVILDGLTVDAHDAMNQSTVMSEEEVGFCMFLPTRPRTCGPVDWIITTKILHVVVEVLVVLANFISGRASTGTFGATWDMGKIVSSAEVWVYRVEISKTDPDFCRNRTIPLPPRSKPRRTK